MRIFAWTTALCALATACGSSDGGVEVRTGSAADHGRALFDDPRTSPSASNVFACSTCHPGDKPADRTYVGASLAGAALRASYWGGKRLDLLESINDCRTFFMDARRPWTRDDEDARAMFAYLVAAQGSVDPLPFDTEARLPPPSTDAARGGAVFERACRVCHGRAHDAAGRLVPFAPLLPEEIARTHPLSPTDMRLYYVRRVRQGAFVSASGSMPPFSRQVLSDDDLGALLAFLVGP